MGSETPATTNLPRDTASSDQFLADIQEALGRVVLPSASELETVTMQELIEEFSIEFDVMCNDRHVMGAEKYGPVNFMTVDSLQMAIEEVADLANYARYTFIKLRLLQHYMTQQQQDVPKDNQFMTFRKH